MADSFEEIARFVADGILVQKIKSKNTGLTIIKADVEGPVVQGYFTLATEAHDHDGCPHTLEHLVFMGSELYPFKGVLDRVANRNFADGTNAWTATDHTAYTLKTAGSEGFLNILPVYLDHILYPTLTDSACYTEVQHINGEGSNSGVVYCEMQAVENTRRNIVNKKLMDFLYPGNSGYKSETGGRLLNLRSLTVDTIRKYHQDYYRVDNLVIIITGKLKDEELFKALAPVEQRILSKQSLPPIVRPWTSPENIQSFTNSITEEVLFPSEDLSVGSATFDSPVSPLTALMCEIDSPYGSSFSYYINLYLSTSVRLSLSDVPVEKLTQVKDFLFATLKEIFDKQDIDMNRMSAVISRTKLKYLESLENNPHETICDQVITDFLYATSPAHLKDLFAVASRLDNFLKEDKSFWLNILKKYILDAPCACVLGRPSVELSKKLVEEEEKRIEQQKKDLGETKMKDLADKLVTAMDTNNTPAPNSLYASQPVPSASNISLVAVDTVQNDTVVSQNGQPVLDKILSESKDKADFFLQFDHIKSSFVAITVLLSTVHVPDDLRLYLELFRELFFKNPVMKGGEQVSSDDVVKGLTEDTIEYSNSLGFGSSSSFSCGTYAQYLNLHVKLETGKYTKVIDWCKLLLWQPVFTGEKIKVAATKLLSEIPKYKLDGFGVARSVLQEVNFMKSSNYKTSNFVRQAQFLNQVIKKLEENPKSVVDDIQNLRSLLTIPSAITVHVAANILNLTPVKTPWLSFLPSSNSAASPAIAPPTVPQHSLKYLAHKEGQGHIIAVPGLESSFLVQTSDTTISSVALSFASPPEDIAAVMVASTYFTMMEGPFWRSIRGGGLAYSFNITPRLEESLVLFYLYRSANLVKAYETAKNIISELIEGKENFDEMSLVEARSSCVHEIVEKAITVGDAAKESLLDHMRQWKRNGYSEVLKHIQTVSVDQLREALNKYIKPLFDGKHSNVVVTTSGGKTDDILKGLSPSGLSLSLIENQESFHSI